MKKEVKNSYAASQVLMEIIFAHGMSLYDFERQIGVTRSQIHDPDTGIPMASFVKLWQVAIHLTNDPALALHLREKAGMRTVHFVVRLAMHSSTLFEAILHLGQYAGLMSGTDKFELFDNDELIEITYTNTAPEYQIRWLPEHNFSLAIELSRSLAENKLNPVQVSFQHPDPGYKDVYDEVFCSSVLFQQPKNSMILRKKDLLKPISTHDPYLQKVLKNYAESTKEKIGVSESLQAQIIDHITSGLPVGSANIKTITKKMNMTRSTLYRQLKAEGVTFQCLLLKTRQEIAKTHLRNGMSSSQVGYLIGFSEPAAFHHAFKRWYDKSPGEFRKLSQVKIDSIESIPKKNN